MKVCRRAAFIHRNDPARRRRNVDADKAELTKLQPPKRASIDHSVPHYGVEPFHGESHNPRRAPTNF